MIKKATQESNVAIAEIFEASNGREALAVLEANQVDALFTDINMPEMNGIELLQAINDRPEWAHLLRVVVSTEGSTARRVELSALKVRTCLEKPFKPELMREVLG